MTTEATETTAAKTTLAMPINAEAREAIESMNEELRQVYDALRRKLSATTIGEVMTRWEIGATVAKVSSGSLQEKYGERALEKLATAFGCGTSLLYAARTFAMAFTKEELEETMKRRNIVGRPIAYSDLLELARVPKKSDRNKLLTFFFKNDVASRALHVKASEMLGNSGAVTRSTGTGTVPRSPIAGLRAISRHASKFAQIGDTINKSIFPAISKDQSKYATEAVSNELVEAEEQLTQLREIIDQGLASISNALVDLTRLQQNASEEEQAAPKRPATTVQKPKKLIRTISGSAVKTAPTTPAPAKKVVRVVRTAKPTAPAAAAASIADDELFAT